MRTLAFLVRRLLGAVVVLWLVATLTFTLFFVAVPRATVPRLLAGKAATATIINEIALHLGLNRPLWSQYQSYLGNLLHGNLGYSYYLDEPVTTIIRQSAPATISLMTGGFLLWVIGGLAVGMVSATRPRSLLDRTATVGVLAGVSAPEFIIGELFVIFVFLPLSTHGFTWLTTGYSPPSQGIVAWAGSMIMPWITLAISAAAIYTRLFRDTMLDSLSQDYVRTARAKGLTERRVRYVHASRAALLPIVTQLGLDIGGLISGDVIVEQVFGIQGIGQQSVQAIFDGDGMLVMATVLLATVTVVLANLVVDMGYAVVDPRVRIH